MVKIIPLKMGINLIADLIDENDNEVVLKKPGAIFMQPQNGQLMIGFSPFLEYTKEFESGMSIKKDDIFGVFTPNLEMINEYNKAFGSGIQIATADVLPLKK